MAETGDWPIRDIRQWRSLGIQPGDTVEVLYRIGRGPFSRRKLETLVFLGEEWASFSIHDYRHWWDRLVRRPVRILLNGEEFEPFQFFDEMRRRGMDVSIIRAVNLSREGRECRIPWKNLISMRKIG